ncbi:MAG: DnaD domain protein [Erysipelotrichaceae bacterium]
MELKAKDTYRVEATHVLSAHDLESLYNPYLALSNPETIGLYCLLQVESTHGTSVDTHSHLCTLLDCRIEKTEEALRNLEMLGLIETYARTAEDHQDYIYSLKAPLSLHGVLAHEVLGRALYQKIGNELFEQLKKRYAHAQYDKEGFSAISAKFDPASLSKWDQHAEAQYQNQRIVEVKLTNLSFDIGKFLRSCSSVVFPLEMRTRETVEKIEELGSIFGISEDEMIRLVGRCVNYKTKRVDLDQLRRRIANEPVHTEVLPENPYLWPPIIFLKEKQNGIEPVDADKRLITKLVTELRLNPEVVNVLIENVLLTNDQRLSKAYVEKIGATWARLGIKTIEEAKKEIESLKGSFKTKGTRKRNDLMPEYKEESQGISEQERLDLFASLQNLGGNTHGKD